MNILNGTLLLTVAVLLNSIELSSQLFKKRRPSSSSNANQVDSLPIHRVTAAGYLDENNKAQAIQSGSTVEVSIKKHHVNGRYINGQVHPFLRTLDPQSDRVIVDAIRGVHYHLGANAENEYAGGCDYTASAIVTELPAGKK